MKESRRKCGDLSELLDAKEWVPWLVHGDLEKLSRREQGREAKDTTQILFRALRAHQIEGTPLREPVILEKAVAAMKIRASDRKWSVFSGFSAF